MIQFLFCARAVMRKRSLTTADCRRSSPRPFGVIAALIGVLALAVTGPVLAQSADLHRSGPLTEQVIAVGDVHGDYSAYIEILSAAGLIDQDLDWAGGRTTLIQVGDVTDRGPDSRQIIDHLRDIQKQADKVGGKVIVLIGNHEAMNVIGDLRFVHPGEYAAFAGRRSKTIRDNFFKSNRDAFVTFYQRDNPDLSQREVKRAFEADYPLGYVEHRKAWAPNGEYGGWTLDNDSVSIIGDTLFVHAGISDDYLEFTVDEINDLVRDAIKAGADKAPRSDGNDPVAAALSDTSPLWFRGFANGQPEARDLVQSVLDRFSVKRIVVGHTPKIDGITDFYGGRVIVIDTGAADYYGGPKSYLRIGGGTVEAVDNGSVRRIPLLPREDGESDY
ncbi:MAG: metallophosphoesterase [Pseudomonadota bacterium]